MRLAAVDKPLPVSGNLELVQRIWADYERGGTTAAYERVIASSHHSLELRFEMPGVETTVIRGHDALRAALPGSPLGLLGAKAYRFAERGEDVLVSSWVRVGENGSYMDAQVRWLFEFERGLLRRVSTLPFSAA